MLRIGRIAAAALRRVPPAIAVGMAISGQAQALPVPAGPAATGAAAIGAAETRTRSAEAPGSGGGRPRQSTRADGAAIATSTAALAATGGEDFLARNGFGSPLCSSSLAIGAPARSNCAASGFAGAPQPLGHWAFDVHIDSSITDIWIDIAAAVEQFLQWLWLALVVCVRALLVALEWCYSINLLGGLVLAQATGALHAARSAITTPGLDLVLAIAAVLCAYEGLIRRRVAQSLGQALAMLTMIVLGLWAIDSPASSLGSLGRWADQASLGTLAALASGSPAHAGSSYEQIMQSIYGDVVGAPWCYMEFGDVAWCDAAPSGDRPLDAAALAIARQARLLAAGRYPSGPDHDSLLASAAAIESAGSNGELFLALPANGPARNSINESSSLLSALCGGSEDATSCRGPTAQQAQFRTQQGLWQRLIGLAVIWLGALGMLGLFGWVAFRLLGAALLALLLLLVAPVLVLAPALGEGGRGLFRAWALRLLGAVAAKLIYSALLGSILLGTRLLIAMHALGWWAQWLLASSLWWTALIRRRELLGVLRLGGGGAAAGAAAVRLRHHGGRPGLHARARARAGDWIFDSVAHGAGRRLREHLGSPPRVSGDWRRSAGDAAHASGAEQVRAQAGTLLAGELFGAAELQRQRPERRAAISAARTQLQRIALAQRRAQEREERLAAAGDSVGARRAARQRLRLAARGERVAAVIGSEQGQLLAAQALLAQAGGGAGGADGGGGAARRGRGSGSALAEREAFLEKQAKLPAAARRGVGGHQRDYRRLAPLAGVREEDWPLLDAKLRRERQLQIDARLAERTALSDAAEQLGREAPSHARAQRRRVEEQMRSGAERQRREAGRRVPGGQPAGAIERWLSGTVAKQAAKPRAPTLAERAERAAERRRRLERQLRD